MNRPLRGLPLVAIAGILVLTGCASAEHAAETAAAGNSGRQSESVEPSAELTQQGGVVVTGGDISDDVGDSGSPVEVIVYEDFQCPYCKALEESSGDYLEDAMEAGDITVEYRIVSFLDQASANEYSSRAANAALCVFDTGGASAFYEFHEALFERQPAEGTPGPEDEQLTAYASAAGAGAAADCIADQAMADQVAENTKLMAQEGVSGTPTVLVDGEQVELDSEDAVEDAVEAAIG